MMSRSLLSAALVAFIATSLGAQAPIVPPDWAAVEGEALGHYQALIRFDTSATERAAAEYLKRLFDQHGIPAQILAKDPERPNVVARLKGSGRKRPLLLLGHLDTVHRRRVEVDVPAVQRHPRQRLRLRPRRHRRQGQSHRGGDDDAAAQAAERAARPRRHPAGRIRRGGRLAPRDGLHGGRAVPADRRRVLHRRGRRHDPRARRGPLRHRAGHREGGARRRADGERHLGPRLGAAAVESDRASRQRGRPLHLAGSPR